MYQDWQITRWDTPVADIDRLVMVSLTDANCELTAVFEDLQSTANAPLRARFRHYPGYRNIDEAYRTDLWQWLDETGQRCGNTFIVTETPLLASWGTVYLHDWVPTIQHFVIATLDDVLEVIAGETPIWDTVDAATVDRNRPRKVEHLLIGEDDDKIDRLVADIKSRNNPDGAG